MANTTDDMTATEIALICKAAALAGYSSVDEYCRAMVLAAANADIADASIYNGYTSPAERILAEAK